MTTSLLVVFCVSDQLTFAPRPMASSCKPITRCCRLLDSGWHCQLPFACSDAQHASMSSSASGGCSFPSSLTPSCSHRSSSISNGVNTRGLRDFSCVLPRIVCSGCDSLLICSAYWHTDSRRARLRHGRQVDCDNRPHMLEWDGKSFTALQKIRLLEVPAIASHTTRDGKEAISALDVRRHDQLLKLREHMAADVVRAIVIGLPLV